MRVLIHNATVNKPEAADARCLNYAGRETNPNTPQVTELVTKDRSHQLQNLLHISAFWCAIIEVCTFPRTWGESLTHKNMKLRHEVAELCTSYCAGHSRLHFQFFLVG